MRKLLLGILLITLSAIDISAAGNFMDVHGAGAQRSDPKTGDPKDYPSGHGPQGDVIRIFNYVRPVRGVSSRKNSYAVVDTNQTECFDNSKVITPPSKGAPFFGQDAQYKGNSPDYSDNGDGTITDNNTGLIWQKDPGDKMSYDEAVSGAKAFELAGQKDWRLPTIKELYSLIDFNGTDPSKVQKSLKPFINIKYFVFSYGDEIIGDRVIDSQFASSTIYKSTTMGGNKTMFGVNFADGRIKGYPTGNAGPKGTKKYFVLYVRGNKNYGKNDFVDNGETVTDNATGLMWAKNDSGSGMNWKDALAWIQQMNNEKYLGYSDWRLPDVKELQSIVDYSRSPKSSKSAAIDPVFKCTSITNEGGFPDFPFYWSSTTHKNSAGSASQAAYVAFGEASGFFSPGGGFVGSDKPKFPPMGPKGLKP